MSLATLERMKLPFFQILQSALRRSAEVFTKEDEEMWRKFLRLWQKEEGQGLTEYALIIALVSVALVTTLGLLTGGIQSTLTSIISSL